MLSDRIVGSRRRSRLVVLLIGLALIVAMVASVPAGAAPSEPQRIVLGDDIVYPDAAAASAERAAWAAAYYGKTYNQLFGWSDAIGVLSTPPLPYGTMTDVWEVWACDTGGPNTVDLNDAIAMLNADVATFFDTISDGQYDMAFQKGGRVTAADHASCRPAAVAAFTAGATPVNGLLVISDNEYCGGNAGPGLPSWDTFPDNNRTNLVGMCSWGPGGFADPSVYRHEFGHALGFPHSFSGLRNPALFEYEYDNRADLMSESDSSTIALNRYAAGWFGEDRVAIGAASNGGMQYNVRFQGVAGTQLLVYQTDTTGVYFAIDARKAGGVDALPNGMASAVTVHAIDHRVAACDGGGAWHPGVCDLTERRTIQYPPSTPTSVNSSNAFAIGSPTLGWIDSRTGIDHVLQPGDEVTLDPADIGAAGDPVTLHVDGAGANGMTVSLITIGGGGATCGGLAVTITGTPGDDVIDGTAGDDVIDGLAGDDEIRGRGGNDTICGREGADTLLGGPGDDTLYGDEGDDFLKGHAGDDTLYGGDGVDRLQSQAGSDTIFGGDGGDRIFAGASPDEVFGEGGRDKIDGGFDDDVLHGGDDTDWLKGRSGDDTLFGDAGSDFLYGGIGDDTGHGGVGNDRLFGEAGVDTLFGDNGRDQVRGQAGDDILDGGNHTDWCTIEVTPPVNCEILI